MLFARPRPGVPLAAMEAQLTSIARSEGAAHRSGIDTAVGLTRQDQPQRWARAVVDALRALPGS
jgi:hypothetical protein